jgi:hypothetical protein
LVDQIADGGGVILCGAEDEGFFVLVDLIHEEFDALGFTGLISMMRLKSDFGITLPSSLHLR